MHNRSDQFGKSILRDALSCASTAETEVEVLAATQRIDVYSVPDPARDAERARMGLLGDLSAEPSLFEPFRNTPTLRELRRCVNKQHTWHHELERRSRSMPRSTPRTAAQSSPVEADPHGATLEPEGPPFPALVVIGPGRPETVIDAYGCKPVSPGVHHGVWGLVLRIVVLAELPRTRETLLLRLLGAGRLLRDALADVAALPDDAWEKSIATPLLIHFKLGNDEAAANEEDDVSAEIQEWYESYQQKLRAEQSEALKGARREGRDEGVRGVLLQLLRARFGALPTTATARIEAADVADLDRWACRVLDAQTLADVLGEPS